MPNEGFNIDNVAELARIKLKPEEREQLGGDLKKIIAYVEQLKELNVEKVEPMSHVINLTNVFRDDAAHRAEVIDKVLKHAPNTAGTYFKVPKVVEQQ